MIANLQRPRIVLLHATPVAVAPVARAMAALWPGAEALNLLDEDLSITRARDGADLSSALHRRFMAFGAYALGPMRADAVLATCSAFGQSLGEMQTAAQVPVVKPNEPMFQEALAQGRNIAMLATFAPAIAGMEAEFEALARPAHPDARLTSLLIPGAIEALSAGDEALHNELVAGAAGALSGYDVIMLAHFSTARALQAAQEASSVPVLSAPESAVLRTRRLVEGYH